MDTLIFTDVDGVLNTANSSDEDKHNAVTQKLEQKHVDKLLSIKSLYNAKIIISSSWRLFTPNIIALYNAGIIETRFLATPYLNTRIRGEEIHEFLRNYQEEIYNFVIFDDKDNMMDYQKEYNFVKIDNSKGLSDIDNFVGFGEVLSYEMKDKVKEAIYGNK